MENSLAETVSLTIRYNSFLAIESELGSRAGRTTALIAEALGSSQFKGQFFATFDEENFTLTLSSPAARPVGDYGCIRTQNQLLFHTRILQCKNEPLLELLQPTSLYHIDATVCPTGGKVILHFETLQQLTVAAE